MCDVGELIEPLIKLHDEIYGGGDSGLRKGHKTHKDAKRRQVDVFWGSDGNDKRAKATDPRLAFVIQPDHKYYQAWMLLLGKLQVSLPLSK